MLVHESAGVHRVVLAVVARIVVKGELLLLLWLLVLSDIIFAASHRLLVGVRVIVGITRALFFHHPEFCIYILSMLLID